MKISGTGVPLDRLRALAAWLEKASDFAFEVVALGFPAFLVWDFAAYHAIWTTGDVADYLFVLGKGEQKPHLVVGVTDVVNEIFVALGGTRVELAWHFTHTYHEFLPQGKDAAKGTSPEKRDKKRQ